MDYRREIDGLRALAVLPVIFFHAGFQTFSGGFVGVDIFFVISGYLITGLITAEIANTGQFGFRRFYARRVRRLFRLARGTRQASGDGFRARGRSGPPGRAGPAGGPEDKAARLLSPEEDG